ncbi:MAG: PAS domain-containing protein, partial [Gemmatimonadota bacterium]
MSFVGRLVAGMVAVLVATVLVLGWSADALLRQRLEEEIRVSLERDARLVAQTLPADTAAYQEALHRLGNITGLRLTYIDSAGRVRAESDLAGDSLSRIENHLNRPEVQQALLTGHGADRRISRTVGRPLLYVAVRSGSGFVRVATGLEQVDAIVSRAQRAVLVASLVALLLGLSVVVPVARSFAGPLTELAASARAIAAGEPPRFPHAGVPDIDALVAALRQMHEELDHRFSELRREQAESATLVEAMIEGVLATDARGRIVTANTAARRLLGYSADQPLPDLRQLFHPKPARAAVDA